METGTEIVAPLGMSVEKSSVEFQVGHQVVKIIFLRSVFHVENMKSPDSKLATVVVHFTRLSISNHMVITTKVKGELTIMVINKKLTKYSACHPFLFFPCGIFQCSPLVPGRVVTFQIHARVAHCLGGNELLGNIMKKLPPKCCYFVVVGGLACLADPRGYASWSFDSW